jgi:hypothetical protein
MVVRETLPPPEREQSNEEAREAIERIPVGGALSPPRELQAGTDTIPDRVTLALAPDGTGVVAWETLTAVRREIRARALREGGRELGPVQEIRLRGKARGPALAAAPGGAFWLALHEEAFPTTRTVVQELRVVR